jgi:hypothetical protein
VVDVWFWRNGKKDVEGGSRVEWEGRKIYILYPVRFVAKQENKKQKKNCELKRNKERTHQRNGMKNVEINC